MAQNSFKQLKQELDELRAAFRREEPHEKRIETLTAQARKTPHVGELPDGNRWFAEHVFKGHEPEWCAAHNGRCAWNDLVGKED
jgi:hypothetical protein